MKYNKCDSVSTVLKHRLTPTRRPHCLITERRTQTVHKHYRSRAHTWKAHTVQTWEEAFLFCRRHANLQGGRNNRHQPCLCLPTEFYCPLCPSHLLISPYWYNVLYRDTQRLHLITLQSLCTMANFACVSLCA